MVATPLPTDLENLVLDEAGRFDVDVTDEIDKVFGAELLTQLKSSLKSVFLHPCYPQRFLQSLIDATALQNKETVKINVSPDSWLDEKFVLQHCNTACILQHPSVSDAELLKIIGDPKVRDSQTLVYLSDRKELDPRLVLDNIDDGWRRDVILLGEKTLLTDQFVRDHPDLFDNWIPLTDHPGLSPAFLLENKDRLCLDRIGNHPRCKELFYTTVAEGSGSSSGGEQKLVATDLLAKFLAEDERFSTQLGPWFFELNPGELVADRINAYFHRRRFVTLRIELIHWMRPYRHLIDDWQMILTHPDIGVSTGTGADEHLSIAHEAMSECREKIAAMDSTLMDLFLYHYFRNPSYTIDFFEKYSDVVPIDYRRLSRNPRLPVKTVIRLKDKLNLIAVLEDNDELPIWLMKRVVRSKFSKLAQ